MQNAIAGVRCVCHAMIHNMQVMRFERDKLVKWWAQSFPAGVQDIVVGFRDDRGFVRSVQTYKTLQLPRFVAGKPHAWDAKLSLAFAVEVRASSHRLLVTS
jgi:hypothetical protein